MSAIVDCVLDVQEAVDRGGFSYYVYEPDNIPGHECNIAQVLNRPSDQTPFLLEAVDRLRDDIHVIVREVPRQQRGLGSKGEVLPAQIEVFVSKG